MPVWNSLFLDFDETNSNTEHIRFPAYLKLVPNTDEAKFSSLLLDVLDIFAVVGVLKQLSNEAVLGLADQTLQRHMESIIVLLHKLGLSKEDVETCNQVSFDDLFV